MIGAAPRFSVELPSAWIEVHGAGEGHDGIVASAIDRLAAAGIPPLLLRTTGVLLQATTGGGAYYLDAYTDEEGLGILLATLAITDVDVDGPVDLSLLEAEVRGAAYRDHILDTERVSCGGRQALRTVGTSAGPGGSAVGRHLEVRFYVPWPERQALTALVFASPNVEYGDEWLALFTSIASTLTPRTEAETALEEEP